MIDASLSAAAFSIEAALSAAAFFAAALSAADSSEDAFSSAAFQAAAIIAGFFASAMSLLARDFALFSISLAFFFASA